MILTAARRGCILRVVEVSLRRCVCLVAVLLVPVLPLSAQTVHPMSAPSATGQVLYETPKDLTFPVGNYVLEAATRNREYAGGPLQEGAKSGPFSFAAVLFNPMPSAPTIRGLLP